MAVVMRHLSLFQRFMLIGFIIMVVGTLGIGWWLGEQIKSGVIRESASTTALYTTSFIAPNLQELIGSTTLTKQHIWVLNHLLTQTDLGRQIVTFKVWDQKGRVIFSSNPALIGRVFPVDNDLQAAWNGNVAADISNLQSDENVEERQNYSRLLQVYTPIRLNSTDQIIAVAEFYQKVDILQADIRTAQWHTWLAVGMTMMLIYLALLGFVRWTSNTINRQESELTLQVKSLRELLEQNGELRERVQRAAANASAVNESFLRRISAELHDGPVQELGAALLRMDRVMGQEEACWTGFPESVCHEQMPAIQASLQNAIREVRAVASGLVLPQIEELRLAEVLEQVVISHERRTGSKVNLITKDLPDEVDLSVKITVYRIVQEALNNAFRHAGGAGQVVKADSQDHHIRIEISDEGPGFDVHKTFHWGEHLGLAGMRERVESLGGAFVVESEINQGARVKATLPLEPVTIA